MEKPARAGFFHPGILFPAGPPFRWSLWKGSIVKTTLRVAAFSLGLLAAVCLGGCELLGSKNASGNPALGALNRDPESVQSELMSFTSTFITTVTQYWNQAAGQGGGQVAPAHPQGAPPPAPMPERTPAERARRAALEIKNANISNAVAIATGPNATVGVADMITLVTLQRMLLEEPQTLATFGPERTAVLVAGYKDQEAKAWRMGARVFSPEYLQELRELITVWRQQNPTQRYIAGVRLEDFARDRRVAAVATAKGPGSLLALVGLDPLSNLDPTVREVQRSRLLAERVFFYTQFAPQIFKGQVESLYMQFLSTPEARRLLASVDQSADAFDAIGAVADDLPGYIAKEREDAIEHLFVNLKRERQETIEQFGQIVRREREALLADLDARQETFRTTLRELRDTVQATQGLSESVKGTIKQADVLVTKVAPDDPQGASAKPATPAPPEDPNAPDAMDKYRAAVEQTAVTAEKLTLLAEKISGVLESPALNADSKGLASVVDALQAKLDQSANRVFWGLIALAVVGAAFFGAAIMFALSGHKALERRRVAKKLRKHARRAPAAE